jgi:hypothetical protein
VPANSVGEQCGRTVRADSVDEQRAAQAVHVGFVRESL